MARLDRFEVCENCRWFAAATEDDEGRIKAAGGSCRRYAPRPLEGGSGTGWADWEWPAVSSSDFCGEWENRHA